MKISGFANKYDVSIDTIRYYIKQKMILPQKDGSQYNFTSSCENDLQTILELKEFDFSINEIKKMLFYIRVSKLEPKQKSAFLHSMLSKRGIELDEEIQRLTAVKEKLKDHFSTIQGELPEALTIGVPVEFMSNLYCRKCNASYNLDSTSIKNSQILEGNLSCSCGILEIKNGIIIGENVINLDASEDDHVDFSDYVKETDVDYFQIFYNTMEWLEHNMDFSKLENKNLLDLGTGFGIFLRRIYNDIPDSCTIICVDYDLSALKSLKKLLSYHSANKKIVFIATDFKNIPLKEKSISCCTEIAGMSNFYLHQLTRLNKIEDELFFEDLSYMFDDNIKYYSMNYVFDKYDPNHPTIPKEHWHLFMDKHIKQSLKNIELKLQRENKSAKLPIGGEYEEFYVKGDSVHSYGYIAKKENETWS